MTIELLKNGLNNLKRNNMENLHLTPTNKPSILIFDREV
jgi:hypothetical protein